MAHMRELPDLNLMAAVTAKPRNVGAFLELQRRYDRLILAAARNAGGGDDSEDIRQEMWLQLLRGGWRIPDGYTGTLQRLIRVITRNTVYQFRLQAGGITRTADGVTLRRYFEPVPTAEGWSDVDERAVRVPAALVATFNPVDEIHTRQLFARLTLAWATLPAFNRMVLRQRFCAPEHTIPEIAAATKRPEIAIRRALVYARQRLCLACGVPYVPTPRHARLADNPRATQRRYRRQLAANHLTPGRVTRTPTSSPEAASPATPHAAAVQSGRGPTSRTA